MRRKGVCETWRTKAASVAGNFAAEIDEMNLGEQNGRNRIDSDALKWPVNGAEASGATQ